MMYGVDLYVVVYLIELILMIIEVVFWVGWSGSVVILLGINFLIGFVVKCRFGFVFVDV